MAVKKKTTRSTASKKQISEDSTSGPIVIKDNDDPGIVTDQEKKINDLKDLTNSLMETVKGIQSEKARDMAYYEALSDVKSATKALLVSQATTAPELSKAIPSDMPNPKSSCNCTSSNCCTFDIIMTEIRVSSMQIEPGDSNIGSMEIRVFAHINGIGAVVPGMFSTLTLHKPIGNPALWSTVNSKIGEIAVPINSTKNVIIKVDGKEVEHTVAENVAFLRDEHGSASGSLSLNCCCETQSIAIEVPFTAGGLGAGNRGSIETRFTAVKKCC